MPHAKCHLSDFLVESLSNRSWDIRVWVTDQEGWTRRFVVRAETSEDGPYKQIEALQNGLHELMQMLLKCGVEG